MNIERKRKHTTREAAMDVTSRTSHTMSLKLAAQAGDLEGINHYARVGGNVNGLDKDTSSPLHMACTMGLTHIVRELLRLGADPNVTRNLPLQTPLCIAALGGCLPLVEMLLEAGADVLHISSDGRQASDFVNEEPVYPSTIAVRLRLQKAKQVRYRNYLNICAELASRCSKESAEEVGTGSGFDDVSDRPLKKARREKTPSPATSPTGADQYPNLVNNINITVNNLPTSPHLTSSSRSNNNNNNISTELPTSFGELFEEVPSLKTAGSSTSPLSFKVTPPVSSSPPFSP